MASPGRPRAPKANRHRNSPIMLNCKCIDGQWPPRFTSTAEGARAAWAFEPTRPGRHWVCSFQPCYVLVLTLQTYKDRWRRLDRNGAAVTGRTKTRSNLRDHAASWPEPSAHPRRTPFSVQIDAI